MEEEGDLLDAFFFLIYNFLFCVYNPPSIAHKPVVPDRYAIKFFAAPDIPTISPTDYSVVSSVNFVPASAFASPCIGTT